MEKQRVNTGWTNQWKTAGVFVGLLLFVGIMWVVFGLWIPWTFGKPEGPGTFGDQFGSLNALFSGLAFGGVVLALWLQQRELSLAIREQRDAAEQHARVVKTQVILDLLDEIRSHDWGAAHAGIWRWRRSHDDAFVESFLRERGDFPERAQIDRDRRTFLKPARKVWSLRLAKVIDDDFAREIISPGIAETLIAIIIPFEVGILKQLKRPTSAPFFEFIRSLYPESVPPSSP